MNIRTAVRSNTVTNEQELLIGVGDSVDEMQESGQWIASNKVMENQR